MAFRVDLLRLGGAHGRFGPIPPVLISVIAALALAAACLTGLKVTGKLGGPAHPAGYETSMAALAPQLVAGPGADPVTGAAQQPACTATQMPAAGVAMAMPGQVTRIAYDGATVVLGGSAVLSAIQITAQWLCAGSLAPMDQGLTNVTAAWSPATSALA